MKCICFNRASDQHYGHSFSGTRRKPEPEASAIAGVYYMAIYMLGFGFSIGIQILIARRNGEGNYAAIGNIFHTGAIGLIALAVFMFFLSGLLIPHIFSYLLSSGNIYNAALSYPDRRIYGFFFSFPAILFRAFYIGITETKILTLNSLVMVGQFALQSQHDLFLVGFNPPMAQ